MKYPLRGPSPPQSGASHHRARSAALVASIQSGSEPTIAHPFGANQCHRPSSPIELNPSLSLPILDMYLLPWEGEGALEIHLFFIVQSSFGQSMSRGRRVGRERREPGSPLAAIVSKSTHAHATPRCSLAQLGTPPRRQSRPLPLEIPR